MKEFKLIILFVVILVLTTSCSIGGDRAKMLNESNEKEEANNTLEEVLNSISEEDKEALKGVFSDQVLENVDNIDEDIEYLFELLRGNVINWEMRTGPQVSETNDHGKKTKELKTWYDVEIDENNFVIFILEYTVDTEQPENLGIYSLRVVKKEDEDAHMTYWQDMMIPGIYRPDK